MTNKEKAEELAINVMTNRHFESNGVCQRKQIENALMEMAEWKDEQIMEKTCNWLYSVAELTGYDSYDLIESYKKAMEEKL